MAARSRAPQLSQSRSIRDRRVPRSGQPIANGEETEGQKKRKKKKKADVLVPWVCGRWRRCDAAAWRMPVRPRRLRCSRRATSCPRAVRPRRCPRARRMRYGQTCWGGRCTLGLVEVSSRAERAGGVWRGAVDARYGRCANMFRRRAVVNGGTFSPTVSTTTTKTMTMGTATATTTAATTVTVTRRLRSRLPLRLRQRRRQRRRWRRRRRRRWRRRR